MAVAIGFDDGANRDTFADVLLNSVKIFAEGSQRNFGPGPAVKN